MMSGGSGKGFCFPRKPLIRKKQVYPAHPNASAHRIAQYRVGGLARFAWCEGRLRMKKIFRGLWLDDEAQDIAEYAVMLAVILVIVVGTVRLIGNNANNVFSSVASSISQ
jgi:Flp pilus assembly pilin Flp